MSARSPTVPTRKSKRNKISPVPPPPRRQVYVVMYSERPLPATTPLPYSPQIIAFTHGISLTPTELTTTYHPTAPATTGVQKIEIVNLSNRVNHPQSLSFMFNAQYGPPSVDEPGGKQKVWICGWTEHAQEAGWMMEEMIRREEMGKEKGKGLSTLQPEWKWEKGADGWLNKAVWETEAGDLLQYDILRVEVRE